MTREAVVEGFEHFIGDAIQATIDEFSVTRALQNGIQGPGSGFVDRLVKNSNRLHRRVIEPELTQYRDRTFEQFHVIIEYAESGDGIDAFGDAILDAGAFENELRTDISTERQEAALESMLDRHHGLGDAIKPLIDSPESSFWDAARQELTEAESERLVEEHFAFTRPLDKHSDALRLAVKINPTDVIGGFGLLLGGATVDVEYTDEALRSLQVAEQSVIETAKADIDRVFEN